MATMPPNLQSRSKLGLGESCDMAVPKPMGDQDASWAVVCLGFGFGFGFELAQGVIATGQHRPQMEKAVHFSVIILSELCV
jgi:hypothetical protein